MHYDSDKTPQILEQLREAVDSDDLRATMQLLRTADAGGKLRADPGIVAQLSAAFGKTAAEDILNAFATDACRYCTRGRERCDNCSSKGYVAGGRVCADCAGLGIIRCPFCNGTGLAGYDLVPRGFKRAVVLNRLASAERQLSEFASSPAKGGARDLARRIVEIDRCRGVLANAVEQARLREVAALSARPAFSTEERMRIEQRCLKANDKAEGALRKTLGALAEVYSAKAERSDASDERRTLYAHRAKTFAKLSKSPRFTGSALRTPLALTPDSAENLPA